MSLIEHDGSIPVIVSGLCFWKSGKRLKRLDVSAADWPGFWETRGDHNHSDPGTEEAMKIRALLRSIPLALGWISTKPIPTAVAEMDSAFDFNFDALQGGDLALAQFRGKALLIVNVASECGFTPQYRGLEKLWQNYRDRGLVVIGVPSNDFGAQEPGTAAEIRQFCDKNYQIDFPLTAKVPVTGATAHPLYKWFEAKLGEEGRPRWNFHKYLIASDGRVVAGYSSRVAPDDAKLIKAIDANLPK